MGQLDYDLGRLDAFWSGRYLIPRLSFDDKNFTKHAGAAGLLLRL